MGKFPLILSRRPCHWHAWQVSVFPTHKVRQGAFSSFASVSHGFFRTVFQRHCAGSIPICWISAEHTVTNQPHPLRLLRPVSKITEYKRTTSLLWLGQEGRAVFEQRCTMLRYFQHGRVPITGLARRDTLLAATTAIATPFEGRNRPQLGKGDVPRHQGPNGTSQFSEHFCRGSILPYRSTRSDAVENHAQRPQACYRGQCGRVRTIVRTPAQPDAKQCLSRTVHFCASPLPTADLEACKIHEIVKPFCEKPVQRQAQPRQRPRKLDLPISQATWCFTNNAGATSSAICDQSRGIHVSKYDES